MDGQLQFIAAQPGWLALFEKATKDGIEIHSEPVIGWCLGSNEGGSGQHPLSHGQAVIGAGPWIEKADAERTAHFFALVREEQLEPDFLAELTTKARHSREELVARAMQNRKDLKQGHGVWIHERRSQKASRPKDAPTRFL